MDGYSRWMVESNLRLIRDGGRRESEIITSLRAGGYDEVADAVDRARRPVREYVERMLSGAESSDELHAEVVEGSMPAQAARDAHRNIERAVDWIEDHPAARNYEGGD